MVSGPGLGGQAFMFTALISAAVAVVRNGSPPPEAHSFMDTCDPAASQEILRFIPGKTLYT